MAGMPAEGVANDITNRMERWVGQASGTKRQESRSIVGASIISNYFQDNVDPNGALTQVNSLALAAIPNLPPGTLPPVVLPFDPTSTTPVCLVAVDSEDPANNESVLYDVGRYEVRNLIMAIPGANAPVVYGGKVRAVMLYIDRNKMQARNLSPLDVMKSMDDYNVFLPTGDAKFGDTDFAIDSNSMFRQHRGHGRHPALEPKGKQRRVSSRRGQPRGLGLHPDRHRPRQRPPRGLHPDLPPARGEHAPRGRYGEGVDQGLRGAGLAAEHQPQGRDGPVDLRPPGDQGAGPGGGDGGLLLRPGHPAVPRASGR